MITVGAACLILALPVALYAGGAALYGARDRRWLDSSRRAVYAVFGLLAISSGVLIAAFLRSDFSVELVADHSSTTTPLIYKFTAVWSSQGGSLLLWALVLSIFASVILYVNRNRHRELAPYATAVMMGVGAFFIGLMLFGANPFTRLSPAPLEGVGLNPLLRHPAMAIHPPMLYSGYVGFTIPFAFAIAALVTRRVDASWIKLTRRYTLVAWTFLSFGILLGAFWSYQELGWGGYWAWDPVENAALIPWLVGTAFLHSVMVQEKRGMLRVWNVSLVALTFTAALVGTFLVRSGILESIHAFGASTVGGPMLALIAVVALGSTALILSRLDVLRSTKRIDSLLSRESIFLVNNILLVGMAAVVFFGTFFPLISEAVTGTRSSLAGPWFDTYIVPIAILLVLFTGIGPIVAWRQVTWSSARRVFLWPAISAGVVALAAAILTDAGGEPWALLLFAVAAFALAALGQEFVKGGVARRALTGEPFARALGNAIVRNRRRYGGYIVHVGISIVFIGVAASSSFQTNREVRLAPGETTEVAGYELRYSEPTADLANERIAFGAVLDVTKDGEPVTTLRPARNYYPSLNPQGPDSGLVAQRFEGEATSEVGLRSGVGRDLWSAMQPDLSELRPMIENADTALDRVPPQTRPRAFGLAVTGVAQRYLQDPPTTTFRLIVNPGVTWLWIGCLVAIGGAALALWPGAGARRRVTSSHAARVSRDLSRA